MDDQTTSQKFFEELFRTFDIKPGVDRENSEGKPQAIEQVEVRKDVEACIRF